MDLEKYTTEMSKSVWDKAFFMDKIEGAKCIIDFGCANGAMINFLAPLFPDIAFIGYDKNKDLIARAEHKNLNTNFFSEDEYGKMVEMIKSTFSSDEICINFSSVWHEILSAGVGSQVEAFCRELNPRYIVIRDMFFTYGMAVTNIRPSLLTSIMDKVDMKYLEEFEEKFGSTAHIKNFIHFLLKYQWKDNGWDDEMEENYFILRPTAIDFLTENYKEIFKARYVLPHLRRKWEKLGIDCNRFRTHIQVIFERKKNNV